MRIRGFLNRGYEPPAPFIKVLLISKKLYIRKLLDLHIDTGASSTIILDKDARCLGLDIKSLKRAEKNIGGIGGLMDTYLIENTIMIFKTSKRREETNSISISEQLRLYDRIASALHAHRLDPTTKSVKESLEAALSLLNIR